MKHLRQVVTAAVCLLFLTGSLYMGADQKKEEKFVPVPETIINQNVPPIPISIKNKMQQFNDLGSTLLAARHPGGKGIIVSKEKDQTNQLFLVESPMGKPKPLTDFKEPVFNANFCPDPKENYFIFRKDVGGGENFQVFRYDMATGKSVMISDGTSRHMGGCFNWKGDSFAYFHNGRTGKVFDVYVTNPKKPGQPKLAFKARTSAYNFPTMWLPDNRHLLVTESISANRVNSLLVDTVTGKWRDLTPPGEGPQVFSLNAVSKDGKYFFGVSDIGSDHPRLIRMERATGKIKVITAGLDWGVVESSSGPARISRDLTRLLFTVNEGGFSRVYLLNTETLEYKPLSGIPRGIISRLSLDPSGKSVFFSISSARMNRDVFELELESNKLVRWTRSDTAGLKLDSFALPTLVQFPTFDKVKGKARVVPAFYYKPTRPKGKPFPVVISIHGGPEGQSRPRFRAFYSYLVNELGIAILSPNVRGSAGYGKSYLLLDNHEKREDSVKDIGALLDWVALQPELDKNRVAVFGGSYGGYMVLSSLVHYSNRLACGVDIVGISNFVTFLKNTADYRRDLRRAEYGDERKIGEFLDKISPSTNAHKIKKPLFVIQGKNDPRVPASEASQIVATVKKNDIPVWYQLAVNEGHGFRKKYNRNFMEYSVIRFFQEFLLK